MLWERMKRAYSGRVAQERNFELAETFFNSATRRVFSTVGVNPDVEFVSLETAITSGPANPRFYRRYDSTGSLPDLIRRILEEYRLDVDFEDLRRDAGLAAMEIDRQSGGLPIDVVETARHLFFRDKTAYIVGRIRSAERTVPLVLPLRHDERGVFLDAVLLDEEDVSVLFSFTRTYFHVEADCPRELVLFLKSILPVKPIAELYVSLGFNKHGKTEQYRSLQRHLKQNRDQFEIAAGDPGMVMLVFALPRFDVVFKVIRDRFDYPKQTTRRQVMENYRLVFKLDRVGRLVDAQEFEHLTFDRELFEAELLRRLVEEAKETVSVQGDQVVVRHLYTERKLTPLNLYLQRVDDEAAREAVRDYGRAIKELAAANIFPGDFLLKNFGVTRHRRVVFYDYDELCLLTDCKFRRMPPPRSPEDELEAEPWFSPGPNDVFPEEFEHFLGLPTPLRQLFVSHHGDLFDAKLWREMQDHHRAGEIPDFYPYPPQRRLGTRP
jgi:isocitrate dehydrogenase kinase/phosphatase